MKHPLLIFNGGYVVAQTTTHRCACYAVETAYHRVLIDTSLPYEKRAILKSIRASGTRQIDAIFLTHCHSDHVANAQSIAALFRCPVYLSEPGLSMLREGSCSMPKGTNAFSRLIGWLVPRIPFYRFTSFPACPLAEPLTDAVVKSYLGEQAALLETPGHSADSVSILLGQQIAFVGDAMVNVMGMLYPPFADEPKTVVASWKRILDSNCELLCPAHGKPLRRGNLVVAYEKEQTLINSKVRDDMLGVELVSLETISEIRNLINEPIKQYQLLQEKQAWLRLTAALDVLEDSSCAVQFYCQNDYPPEIHGKYLYTYGLLQALFLQQDAILGISLSLLNKGIDFKNEVPSAYEVRELRNDVAGHPTGRGKKDEPPHFIHLAQISMRKNSFYYIKDSTGDSSTQCKEVDILSSISGTSSAVNSVLSAIYNHLLNEHYQHLSNHKERKMTDIFNNLNYAREKVLLNDFMKPAGYASTKRMVADFEREITLRYGSIDALDSIKYLLSDVHEIYTLIDDNLDRLPADICSSVEKYLLECLFTKLSELEECSKEIDEYFDSSEASRKSPFASSTSITDDI